MKLVFTDAAVVPCDMVRVQLDVGGIKSMLKNERGSTITGIGWPIGAMPALTFAWPEVWVNDEDYEAAVGIVADMKRQAPANNEGPWICGRCGETVDGELASCWKCDAEKSV